MHISEHRAQLEQERDHLSAELQRRTVAVQEVVNAHNLWAQATDTRLTEINGALQLCDALQADADATITAEARATAL